MNRFPFRFADRSVRVGILPLLTITLCMVGCGPAESERRRQAETELQKSVPSENQTTDGDASTAAANDAERSLPMPDLDAADADGQKEATGLDAATGLAEAGDDPVEFESFKGPWDVAADYFVAPENATPISKDNLWVDRDAASVYADGYVAMRQGPLELFACGSQTKEHESIVGVLPRAGGIHAALLAVGAEPGSPIKVLPEYTPATGQAIRVWVAWLDGSNQYRVLDARQWIAGADGKTMQPDWVFAGSSIYTDPETKKSFYRADRGDMICVSNFSTAMLDIPIESSAQSGDLFYEPKTDLIPPEGTPVRLILQPISDDAPRDQPPQANILKRNPNAMKTPR